MDNYELFSTSQAAEICSVTKRTLRYYESKGLIKADRVAESGYKYYTMETLRRVQVIRYFLEEGFSLSMVEKLLATNDLDEYEEIFREQMEITKDQILYYQNRLDSLRGWYGLLCEGKRIKMTGPENITLKHVPTQDYLFMDGILDVDDPYSEAKLETEHYTIAKSNGHSMIDVGGAYTLYSKDFRNRINMFTSAVTLIQQAYPNSLSRENIHSLKGFLAVSAYHMGKLANIPDTYRRAVAWADSRGIELIGSSYERYVIDIYTSDNEDDYVTEILLPVKTDHDTFNYYTD